MTSAPSQGRVCSTPNCWMPGIEYDLVTGAVRCRIHKEGQHGQAEAQEGTRQEEGQETTISPASRVLNWVDHVHDGRLTYTELVAVVSVHGWEQRVSVSLEPRPHYCDRGHWVAKVAGVANIDSADAFPRYYMDFSRAKAELEAWLKWRLWSET